MSALGGGWGALGCSQRFSGYGFNRALAYDSFAQGLFLLISQPFYKFSLYMDSNEDPGAPSGGPGGCSGDFQAMDLIAREAPGALWEGLGVSQLFLEDSRASLGLRRSSGILGMSSS